MGKQRRYGPEFKQRAVKLAEELGNITGAARKLGIPKHTLYNWIRPEGEPEVKSKAVLSPEDKIRELERENEELKKANYILKQAAAFFSQDHLK